MARTAKAEGAWFRHTDLVRQIVVGLDMSKRQHRIYEVLLGLALPPGSPNAGKVLRGPDGVNRGRPPTNVLVAELSGVPRQHVAETLDELVARGLVRRTDGGGLEVVNYSGITDGSATEWVAKLVGQRAATPDPEAAAEPKGQDAGQPETAESVRRREWGGPPRPTDHRREPEEPADPEWVARRLEATDGLRYLSVIADRCGVLHSVIRGECSRAGVAEGEANELAGDWTRATVVRLARAHESASGLPADLHADPKELRLVLTYAASHTTGAEARPGRWCHRNHRPVFEAADVPMWREMLAGLEREGPLPKGLLAIATSAELERTRPLARTIFDDVDPDDFRGGDDWECEAEPLGTEEDGWVTAAT